MSPQPSRFAYQARRHLPERIIQGILFLAAFSAVAVTIAIVVILVYESLGFFKHVSIWEFVT
ncbi:MAG: phosphate ABC transporter permease subunit PstC, partial [Pseudomonadota bacterium]